MNIAEMWKRFAKNLDFYQCCGSGILDQVPFCSFLTPGSGIRNRIFPDLGSRIPNPYFWELSVNFLGKKFYNSLKIGPNFFLHHFKKKIICNFVKFLATKKGMTIIFFSPLSFVLVFWSGIRDTRSGIRDPRSGIRDRRSEIWDPRSGIRDPRSRIRDPGWVKIRIRDPG